MKLILSRIEQAIVENAIGFAFGTMFGMWLIVMADCFVRGNCR